MSLHLQFLLHNKSVSELVCCDIGVGLAYRGVGRKTVGEEEKYSRNACTVRAHAFVLSEHVLPHILKGAAGVSELGAAGHLVMGKQYVWECAPRVCVCVCV